MTPEDVLGTRVEFFPVQGTVDAVLKDKRMVRIEDHWFELSREHVRILEVAWAIKESLDHFGSDMSRFIPAAKMAIEAENRHNQQRAMADAA
ncbi:MAG: hypothetical protein KF810_16895 [Rhizobiaceae bacterium]|nr:hypothetical protein [Rhizobiaceae bacterium]